MKSKKGAMSAGVVILLIALAVFAYSGNWFGLKDILTPEDGVPTVTTKCPSSGLTEVTINAQEALASSATDAEVDYYIYDNSKLVKEGSTTSGAVSFDVECGVGKTYKLLVINETVADGFYPQTVTVDASGPTDTHNFKMFQYGEIGIGSIVSSADPTGGVNISGGAGKTCGFTLTFSNNESASGFDKPLIMCQVNSTAIADVTMSGVTEVNAKRPLRISAQTGHQYYTFEYPELIKSTDAAVKISGKIQFSTGATFSSKVGNNMSCIIVDQTMYKTAEYKTLSLSEGFIEAAENKETIAEIGAIDSNRVTMQYGTTAYC